ncbi:MAG: thiamine phosphate synthase [Anaerohalosphaera sp.]|nr:thiamine phosphate synthase [Anaerohalosphaera sp.]
MENSIYRIIDANLNRSREAARVIEEFCRFTLNSPNLSARAKQLRHKLASVSQQLDPVALIVARDSQGDVGQKTTVTNQQVRRSLYDCLVAACKRITEALRALAETSQTIDPAIAKRFEALRFEAYSLEKDIIIASHTITKASLIRLYVLITAESRCDNKHILDIAAQCAQGGADCIQLRAKGISDSHLCSLADDFVKVCADQNVLSIINDRIDIAVNAGADGVHFGQDDIPVAVARKLMQKPMIMGLSTHCMEQLAIAIDLNVEYVGIGPVFNTQTKPGIKLAGPKYLRDAVAMLADTSVRHVAIGGITLENVEQVLSAGAKAIAVCSAVTDSPDPKDACKRFKGLLPPVNGR